MLSTRIERQQQREDMIVARFTEELSGLVGDNVLWSEDARQLMVLASLMFLPDHQNPDQVFRHARRLARSYDLHASRIGGKLWVENGTHKLEVPALEDR